MSRWVTYIYTHTERLTGLADTTTTHERLLSQGKHTDISSCIFELSNRHFNTSSIQLILSKSCYSFFCVKFLPCASSHYAGIYIYYLLPWQLYPLPVQPLHLPWSISFWRIKIKCITLFWKSNSVTCCLPNFSSSPYHIHV